MMKHDMLRHFVAVAETGSLAAGAARVGRSASAVSMMLKQFQDTIGAPLFATDRKTQLTPLGRFTLDQARAELAHFDRMQRAIVRFARTGGGVIRVASIPSVAGVIMPDAIAAFRAAHPNVELDVRDMESAAVIKGMQDGVFDLGIAYAPDAILKGHRTPLFEDRFGIICAPDHPLAVRSDGVYLRDLAGTEIITNHLAEELGLTGQGADIISGPLVVHNTLSLLALVQGGVGIAILPEFASRMAWKSVVFVPLLDTGVARTISMFEAPNLPASALVAALVGCVRRVAA